MKYEKLDKRRRVFFALPSLRIHTQTIGRYFSRCHSQMSIAQPIVLKHQPTPSANFSSTLCGTILLTQRSIEAQKKKGKKLHKKNLNQDIYAISSCTHTHTKANIPKVKKCHSKEPARRASITQLTKKGKPKKKAWRWKREIELKKKNYSKKCLQYTKGLLLWTGICTAYNFNIILGTVTHALAFWLKRLDRSPAWRSSYHQKEGWWAFNFFFFPGLV